MAAQAPFEPNSPVRENKITHIEMRLRLPLIWLGILIIAAFLLPDRIWNTLLIGFGGLFITAYIWVWHLSRNLHATRRLRFGWVAVGDRLEEEFSIINNADLPALWVELIDESNVPGYHAAIVRSIGPRQEDRWRQAAICTRRGQFHLGPWIIRTSDPFGIFLLTKRYTASRSIIIHPPIHGHLPIPLPTGQSSGRARARQRALQATINAATVRQYRPNDPKQWIHWRTSAHRGELYVREFDLDAAGAIWILVDMQANVQLGQDADGTEEHAILLAASLAARAIRQNRPVGVACYGRIPQIIAPGQGQGQQWKILRALAIVNADSDTNLSTAMHDLSQIVQRGAAAIIITPDGSAEWLPELLSLARHGVQANVILLDRPSFGGEGNSDGLRNAVRQLGFAAQVVHQGQVGRPLTEQVQRGVWEFKVTAMGKAIAIRKPGD